MPCPYFQPLGQLVWPSAPKLPLGDAYSGLCRAQAGRCAEPDPATLKDLCNLGYARGRCPLFPQDGGPDAVRFAVTKDAAGVIQLQWVREKDHHPMDHGMVAFSVADGDFTAAPAEESVRLQTRAYIESYLRRRARKRTES